MADLTLATRPHVAIPDLPISVRSGRTLLALDLGTTTGWALHGIDGLHPDRYRIRRHSRLVEREPDWRRQGVGHGAVLAVRHAVAEGGEVRGVDGDPLRIARGDDVLYLETHMMLPAIGVLLQETVDG